MRKKVASNEQNELLNRIAQAIYDKKGFNILAIDVRGISSLTDITKLSRIGYKTILIYIVTTVFATTVGLTMVNIMKPGDVFPDNKQEQYRQKFSGQVEIRQESAREIEKQSPLHFFEDRSLLVLGFLFLPVYIFVYYYSLNIDLLTKSFVLMGSGVFLIVARVFLGTRKWAKECAGNNIGESK